MTRAPRARVADATATATSLGIATTTATAAVAGPAPRNGIITGDTRARAAATRMAAGADRPGGTALRSLFPLLIMTLWPQIPKHRSTRAQRLDEAPGPGPAGRHRREALGSPSDRPAPALIGPRTTAGATAEPELLAVTSGRATTAMAAAGRGRIAGVPAGTARAALSRRFVGGARTGNPADQTRTLRGQRTLTIRQTQTPTRRATAR